MADPTHAATGPVESMFCLRKFFFLITQHKHLLILHKHNSGPINIHICVFIVFSSIFGNIYALLAIVYKQKFYFL